MPDNVGFVEIDDGDLIQIAEAMNGIDQAAAHLPRQVHLRDVSRHDDFRTVAHARQKHLHLRNRCILAFVQDNDRLIKGAAAHISQGNDFNNVVFHVAFNLVRHHHVIEGVEERPQVRVDLGHDVAGQES